MKSVNFFLLLILNFLSPNLEAGAINVDSVKKELKAPSEKKFKLLHDFIYSLNNSNVDTAILLANFYLEEARNFGDKKIISNANYSLGIALYGKGRFQEAIKKLKFTLKYSEKSGDLQREIETLNALGLVYLNLGKMNSATETLFNALTKCKNYNNDPITLASIYQNLGLVYNSSGEMEKSIDNMELALDATQKTGDSLEIIHAYFNLGAMYANNEDYVKGEEHFVKAREFARKLNDKKIEAAAVNNLALIYYFRKSYDKANKFFEEALILRRQVGDEIGVIETLSAIGTFYLGQNEFKKADLYCRKAFDEANRIQYRLFNPRICECISDANKSMGNFKDAYEFYILSHNSNDSLNNLEQQSKLAEEEQKMKYKVKAAADSVIRVEEKKVEEALLSESEAKLKQEKTQRYALIGGLSLVVLFALFIFNRLRVIRKQRDVISLKEAETQMQKKQVEHQKEIIEEKQKEIIDSINYAKRLQQAILVPKEVIDTHLPGNFLFYLPKDIVAGDFYFFEATDSHIFYAAADCTGHGVPGAMVSIVCSNALTRCVNEFELTEPGKILDKARELILETFNKSGEDVKDGMDISFISIHRNTEEIKWAGANNPLWFIEKGEMKEIKADKQPIGKSDYPKPFTTHSLPSSLTTLFLFTDGFADQFGGEKGKKFKYSNLQKLLLENAILGLETMNLKLQKAFSEWKGDLEQVDDVCVIGIRI